MSIHNRTTSQALIALALVVIFAGAGCDLRRSVVPVGDVPANGVSDTTEDTGTDGEDTTAQSVTWTTYDSPMLGLRVPYPEGWSFQEAQDEDVFTVFINPTPLLTGGAGSDAPMRVTITRTPLSLDDALSVYDETSTLTTTEFGNRQITRVEYRSELGAPPSSPTYRAAYHWRHAGQLYTVDGVSGDAVVEYVVQTLATQEN